MSVDSRMQSYRYPENLRLLHSGLGSVNPVTAQLELTVDSSGMRSHKDRIRHLSALLHERHHWLQHVGTLAGVTNRMLLELQAGTVAHSVDFRDLEVEDLPLLKSKDPRHNDTLRAWEETEAVRWLVFGSRASDYQTLQQDGRQADFGRVVQPVQELALALEDSPVIAGVLRPLFAQFEPGDYRRLILVPHNGRLVGAKHLMETAARLSEVFRAEDLAETLGSRHYDRSNLWSGEYAVIRSIWDEYSDLERNVATEVGLAYACDLALNGQFPPIYPLLGSVVEDAWTPGARFVMAVGHLKTFPFPAKLDPYDPHAVRTLIRSLDDHCESAGWVTGATIAPIMSAAWGNSGPDEYAPLLYQIRAGHLVPKASATMQYYARLSGRAFHLRMESPELFIFPVCRYVHDRADFRAQFQQVQPPLVRYGDDGVGPTSGQPGWLDYWVMTGILGEVLRGVVYNSVDTMAADLSPFQIALGWGGDWMEHYIRKGLGDCALSQALIDALASSPKKANSRRDVSSPLLGSSSGLEALLAAARTFGVTGSSS